MNLLQQLCKKAPNRVFVAIAMGGLAGIGNAFLIPLVLAALGEVEPVAAAAPVVLGFEVSHPGFAAAFFALCGAIFCARLVSRVILIRVSLEFAADLRITLSRMIAAAPIAEVEQIGPSRLTAVLTEDVARIVAAAQIVPGLLTSLVTLGGTLAFLLYLDAAAFRFVLWALLLGVLSYQVPVYFGARMFRRARGLYDDMQEALRGLIYGAKELKLDAAKRGAYFDQVLVARELGLLAVEKRAYTTYIAAGTYGDMVGFLVIGVVAFFFVNYYSLGAEQLVGIVMALLYVAAPVSYLMTSLPEVTLARTAMRNIERLLGAIAAEAAAPAPAAAAPWQRIELRAVTFRHVGHARQDGFAIGPIDLCIERGRTTFIVGGNGSGKSTVSKLLALHYTPAAGTVAFGGDAVTPANVESYRQQIGAVFSDYYLFDSLLRPLSAGQAARAARYLAELGLADKVAIVDGRFSTLRLSDGQRRRLALLVTLLDDKQLYLFDEWAADQDPVFKDAFYHQVLPALKAAGKAVVVISHDDRYFHTADHLLVLDHGRLRGAAHPSR